MKKIDIEGLPKKLLASAREAQMNKLYEWGFEHKGYTYWFFQVGGNSLMGVGGNFLMNAKSLAELQIARFHKAECITVVSLTLKDWERMIYTECGLQEFCRMLQIRGHYEASLNGAVSGLFVFNAGSIDSAF